MILRPNSLAAAAALVLAVGAGCSDSLAHLGTTTRLVVAFSQNDDGSPMSDIGTRDHRLPLSFDTSAPLYIDITAMGADNQVDTAYSGYVRLSIKPGSVVNVSGDAVNGRNVVLQGGVAKHVAVSVAASYGPSHIWAEDVGYTPADPRGTVPPQCADGVDNNGNGLVDFPAEPGCAFANDDSEALGTYAAGASPTLWFTTPRIADVRGLSLGGVATAFPHEQVDVDTSTLIPADKVPRPSAFSVVVTRISSDGFYLTDVDDKRGFTSVFAYNFSTPPLMRVCDRLQAFSGTSADFFGFTEIGFPTWQIEPWDPSVAPCAVPEPHLFGGYDPVKKTVVNEIQRDDTGKFLNTTPLIGQIAAMVRVQADPEHNVDLHVASKFGPGLPAADDNYLPHEDASNCDLNKDGKVDFATDPEATCAKNCAADIECSEFSAFLSQSEFYLVVSAIDPVTRVPVSGSIQADGSTDAEFNPVALRGQPIHSFTGTLRYFSGGTQFTIEARCEDDIVVDMNQPALPSTRACVPDRTGNDNSSASN